jgi:prepilin-type N-terminal cleavage/methylation domain-containing protein
MSPWHSAYNKKGFTLLEIIIATSITSILVILIYNFMSNAFLLQNFISEQSEAISEAQHGVGLFTKEAREAQYSDSGAYIIETAEEQEIIFYSDVDADVATEKVHYYYEGDNLIKGVIEPSGDPLTYNDADETTSVISSWIVNGADPIFTYYNEDYPDETNALEYPADVTEVTMIKIHLDVNVNPEKIPDTYTLETFIQLRNLKSNL